MKAIQWLVFAILLTISTSCSVFSYLKAHPKEEAALEKIAEDSVETIIDMEK